MLNKGDSVHINISNTLADTTTVHWHGMHVSPQNDGGPHTVIPPATTWSPKFKVRDEAAMYWYHSHLHMHTAMQVTKGEAGLVIVKDPIEAALVLPRTYGIDDIPLVVQTRAFDAAKQFDAMSALDSVVLINGTKNPFVALPAQVVRLRLINAATMRLFNFGFSNNATFHQIASDGGLLSAPVAMTRLRLAPGERAEVLLLSLIHIYGMRALSIAAFEAAAETTDALILDTRPAAEFAKGFIPRTISIGINGDFAPWVGALIKDVKQPILLITEVGMEEEVVTRLSRVGFDNIIGHLKGGFETWKASGKEIDSVNRIPAAQFAKEFDVKSSVVIDVRRESEYRAEHVEESYNKPLDQINGWFAEMDNDKPFYLHCAGGYRSMIAASILKSRGVHNFKEVEGGFKAIAEAGVPKTDYVCQSKLQKN